MGNFNNAEHLLLLGDDCSKLWVFDLDTKKPVGEFELNGSSEPLKVDLVEGHFLFDRVSTANMDGFDFQSIPLDPTNKLCSTTYGFIGATDIQDERYQNPNQLVKFPICLKKVSAYELHVHVISDPKQKQ